MQSSRLPPAPPGSSRYPFPINHVDNLDEPFPTRDALQAATKSHSQGNFTISARKLPISKAGAIDHLTDEIGIPMPEMIFGDNVVSILHRPSKWYCEFNTPDALDAVDKTDKHMLKVAYARDWESTREGTTQSIKGVVKPYDWSYSTTYAGTVGVADQQPHDGAPSSRAAGAPTVPRFQATDKRIPIELLKRRDPILFFDEVVLYESELDDNGISIYSAKVRVHQQRMLLLCRLFMRLDNVVVRLRDTRVYVDFETDEVIREYTAKEAKFDHVKRKLAMSGRLPDEITIVLRDPNELDPLLDVVQHKTEALCLKQT
ncbi:TipA protein [Metarhizium album ARSEF 1941]|uniref:TipA protein n=1 Tax=Metarhizium album (strain ARSEF 1941) TaxID=1081103 RepID=A0A0B2WRU0_METAS|nr:TipA protein [Metarhizium album ARSEF 1941]KHN96217.1 TipA protein [Metarhizium album ARSEF 1941]